MVQLKGTFSGSFFNTTTGPLTNQLFFTGNTGTGAASPIGPANVTLNATTQSGASLCDTFQDATVTLSNAAQDTLTLKIHGSQCRRVANRYVDLGHLDKVEVPVLPPGTAGPFGPYELVAGVPGIFIDGHAAFDVVGGTGHYAGATGTGGILWKGEVTHPGVLSYDGFYEPFTIDGFVTAPA